MLLGAEEKCPGSHKGKAEEDLMDGVDGYMQLNTSLWFYRLGGASKHDQQGQVVVAVLLQGMNSSGASQREEEGGKLQKQKLDSGKELKPQFKSRSVTRMPGNFCRRLLTLAMEMVCCSMASWMATRSSSRIFSRKAANEVGGKKINKSCCQLPPVAFS